MIETYRFIVLRTKSDPTKFACIQKGTINTCDSLLTATKFSDVYTAMREVGGHFRSFKPIEIEMTLDVTPHFVQFPNPKEVFYE